VRSPPAVADGKVYFGGYDSAKVYCVDAETGQTIWVSNTGYDTFWGGPAVANGKVYIAGEWYNIYCLDGKTGESIWDAPITAGSNSCPAVYEGKVYIGSCGNKLYCFDAETGDEIWAFTAGSDIDSSPAVYQGKVYFGSYDHKVYCVDAETGLKQWNYTIGHEIYSSPAIYDGKLYIGGGWSNDKIYCLDAETGEEIWISNLSMNIHASPAIAYGNVYINSADTMYCFDAESGEEIWNNSIGFDSYSSPAVADYKVYYSSGDLMICLDAETGESIWQYNIGGTTSSPAVVNGRVYIGASGSSKFYAFGSSSLPPYAPTITGPISGNPGVGYEYKFKAIDYDGDEIYYYVDWGDGTNTGWFGPYPSGEEVAKTHMWNLAGDYEIKAKAKDINNNEGDWSSYKIRTGDQSPEAPIITGPARGKVGETIPYEITTTDPDDNDVYYFVVWGDNNDTGWIGPYNSSEIITITHEWSKKGTYTITAKARDIWGYESNSTTIKITIPRTIPISRNKTTFNSLFYWFLERFPNMLIILRHLMGLY